MELNLLPQMTDATVYEGEGGGYYSWTPAKSPVLSEAAVGAGKLVLHPRGLALPHYANCNKIGYVAQGKCTVGVILPNSQQEQVMIIQKGEVIPLAMGSISWWFNDGDSDLTVILLGETTRSYNPGEFDYFFLAGAAGLLGGFSIEFTSKIYSFTKSDAEMLTKSQPNTLVVKIKAGINMPNQSNCQTADYVFDLDNYMITEPNGYAIMTADNFGLVDQVGLSAGLVRLGPGSVFNPSYTTDGSQQIIYVLKGSGEIQIVGLNGARVVEAYVKEGHLFVVPRFFVIAQIAAENGMDFLSVFTSPRPMVQQLGGIASRYKILSSSALEAALNVTPEFVELFKSK